LLESTPSADDAWGASILSVLAELYARGHALAECGLADGAPDLPEEFDVTDDEYREVSSRLSRYFARRDVYYCCLDTTAELYKQEPSIGLLSGDLGEIYRDVAPGVRAWDAQRDDLLQVIVFDWKLPAFHSHWGRHAAYAMLPLHELVYDHGIRP